MPKFYRKYELVWKITSVILALFLAITQFFFTMENKNFHKFFGIIWLVFALFNLVEAIELIKKGKAKKFEAKNVE